MKFLVFIIILGIGGYFVYEFVEQKEQQQLEQRQQKQKQQKQKQSTPKTNSLPQKKSSAKVDPCDNFDYELMYEGDRYGYDDGNDDKSIQYRMRCLNINREFYLYKDIWNNNSYTDYRSGGMRFRTEREAAKYACGCD